MYNVNANGQTTETTSYEAAKNVIKASVSEFAAKLAQPVRPGLFKSFKATKRINEDRVRSAAKLASGVKLPKKAEDVSGNVGGFAFAIARK